MMNGFLVIDKPAGMTSHDVVSRVRKLLGERSVGHLGTLDPMATGVLPLVVGRMTRLAQFYTAAEKAYEGEIRLGFATDTYDAAGDAVGETRAVSVSRDEVETAAGKFRGTIEQMPPPFSAKKIAGVPAYKLARKKKDVELKPVQVQVSELAVLGVEGDRVRFRAAVSSGTYLRSIAHELGQELGCGGHLASLRRTRVAEFTLADARTLEQVAQVAEAAQRIAGNARDDEDTRGNRVDDSGRELDSLFVHPRRVLPAMPSVTANEEHVARISTGQSVNLPELSKAPLVKVFRGQAEIIAIASRVAGTLFHPKVVLLER
ncbi:MAG TPA: tRNA pseudouridine(55) synthase TruB [Terriglobales bacterium]|nr:tRNA pseudouridine(55) synthase TruB [Terriglobales bacterium]